MRAFGVDENFVRLKISSAKGWTYYAAAKQMEMSMFGAMWQLSGDGYIAAERKKILAKPKS